MLCKRRERTLGSGETGLPRTHGGPRIRSGESGLPAPAQRSPAGLSSGSLANPSVHLQMDHRTRCGDGNWPRWIRTTIPRSKVWCPAVGRGASDVTAPQLSCGGLWAGAGCLPLAGRGMPLATERARSCSSRMGRAFERKPEVHYPISVPIDLEQQGIGTLICQPLERVSAVAKVDIRVLNDSSCAPAHNAPIPL